MVRAWWQTASTHTDPHGSSASQQYPAACSGLRVRAGSGSRPSACSRPCHRTRISLQSIRTNCCAISGSAKRDTGCATAGRTHSSLTSSHTPSMAMSRTICATQGCHCGSASPSTVTSPNMQVTQCSWCLGSLATRWYILQAQDRQLSATRCHPQELPHNAIWQSAISDASLLRVLLQCRLALHEFASMLQHKTIEHVIFIRLDDKVCYARPQSADNDVVKEQTNQSQRCRSSPHPTTSKVCPLRLSYPLPALCCKRRSVMHLWPKIASSCDSAVQHLELSRAALQQLPPCLHRTRTDEVQQHLPLLIVERHARVLSRCPQGFLGGFRPPSKCRSHTRRHSVRSVVDKNSGSNIHLPALERGVRNIAGFLGARRPGCTCARRNPMQHCFLERSHWPGGSKSAPHACGRRSVRGGGAHPTSAEPRAAPSLLTCS